MYTVHCKETSNKPYLLGVPCLDSFRVLLLFLLVITDCTSVFVLKLPLLNVLVIQ